MAITAKIEERGNGFPAVGDYVPGTDGLLYRVLSTGSTIHTMGGRGNWVTAQVEEVDWSVCEDGDEHQSAVIDESIEVDE